MFQILLLNKYTGFARINIAANSKAKNAPINAKRIINFGKQTTRTKQIDPSKSPNNKDNNMISMAFKMESLTES